MNSMDSLFSHIFQHIHQNILLVDREGMLRLATGIFAEVQPGSQLTEIVPAIDVFALAGCSTAIQGPVQLIQQGDFYYQVFAVSERHFQGYCLLFRAGSERVALQQENAQMQQLLFHAEKMAVIGQLTTSVTHEINNPIGYVYSNLHTLSDYVANLIKIIESLSYAKTPDQRAAIKQEFDYEYICEDIRNILKESGFGFEQVIAQIKALKDVSHTDEGKFQLADIQPGILSSLNIVNNEFKYKAVISKELAELPLIECIPSQLYQVMLNLLMNAGQAIEQRGEICLRTGAEADWIWLEVADNGAGIERAKLAKIFEPFFTTKAIGKGTGLGLAISKSIIERHHGRIEVTSEPGIGSCFKIWLPIKQPAAVG